MKRIGILLTLIVLSVSLLAPLSERRLELADMEDQPFANAKLER